jgi:hypothetical protein
VSQSIPMQIPEDDFIARMTEMLGGNKPEPQKEKA